MNEELVSSYSVCPSDLPCSDNMLHAGMGEIAYLWGDELAFCKKFAPFIGNHNIEALVREMELAAAQG